MRTESGRLLMPTPSRSEPQAGANPPLTYPVGMLVGYYSASPVEGFSPALRHAYRPMPLVLQYTAAIALNISNDAQRCASRWNRAVTAVNNASHDSHWHLSGLDGWHQGELYKFNSSVLFVHVGKAGGGTIVRMLDVAHVAYDHMNVAPVPCGCAYR